MLRGLGELDGSLSFLLDGGASESLLSPVGMEPDDVERPSPIELAIDLRIVAVHSV